MKISLLTRQKNIYMKRKFTSTIAILFFFALLVISTSSEAQNGLLDLSFDTDGKVTTTIGTAGDVAYSVAIQTDGKIVVAGEKQNGINADFALVRYNTNGSLDTSFSGDGKVTTDFGGLSDNGISVAIQTNGKIVVAGRSSNGIDYDFAIARYNTDGSLDNTFDSDGKVTTAVGNSDDWGSAVAIQTDGKILVAGYAAGSLNYDFAAVRYNTNGSLDNSFNTDGKVTTDIAGYANLCSSIAIQPNGKIVLGGSTNTGTGYDFAVIRYDSTGSLDNTFDTDGIVNTDIDNSSDDLFALAIQNDGRIIAVGVSDNGNGDDFALVRYNTNGSLDNSFDTNGKVTTNIGNFSDDRGLSVAIQSDGKILVAGDTEISNADFAVVSYNADGSLNTGFDTDGKVTTAIASSDDDRAFSIAIQNDGKIVVVGGSIIGSNNYDFSVVRYNNTIIAGIEESGNETLTTSIYPNPAKDLIEVTREGNELNELCIFDIHGKEILKSTLQNDKKKLDISGLSNGVYMVKQSSTRYSSVQKLVVQH
ncbi:T9SS type A sorting domain-containing protein [Dolichospermum sp. ST_sed3]|nr:T9SS type A sorting domain-containing protein [Dolichospermum sp. ST_sed3]